MRILITGGAGSIGSELALRALNDGHQVTVFDLPSADYSIYEGRERVKLSKVTSQRSRMLERGWLLVADAIIHLAALMPHLCTDRQKRCL